jgi:hypothetical protein
VRTICGVNNTSIRKSVSAFAAPYVETLTSFVPAY